MTFAKDFHLNSMAVENTNIIQTRAGEIVLYQPDANTHLEVRVDDVPHLYDTPPWCRIPLVGR